jgi:hypothetical protein
MILAALLSAPPAHAQVSFEAEAGGGYTVVDVETIAFNDGANALDWSQPTYRIAGRVLLDRPGFGFGAEIAHQHLYWYSVRIPFGSTPIHREYDVSGMSAMALARLGVGSAILDLGAGASSRRCRSWRGG